MKRASKLARWAWASAAVCGILGSASAAPPAAKPAPAVTATPAVKSAPLPNLPAGKTVATVNGETISWGQLVPLLEQAGPIPADLPEVHRRELYREALGTLIDDLLMAQYVKKALPPADPAEVNKMMADLLEGLKKQGKTLAELCKESRQTEAEIRQDMAQYIQWNGYFDKRLTEADLQKYYNYYKDYFDRITVRASHIFLQVAANASPGEKAQAKAKLQQLRAEIIAGRIDFAQAARTHSDCLSKNNGGDVGFFPRKFRVDESFARAAYALKPGEISDVVEGPSGMHLIKVTERKPGQPTEFAKIKGDVRAVYMEEMQQNVLMQMRKEAKIEIFLP